MTRDDDDIEYDRRKSESDHDLLIKMNNTVHNGIRLFEKYQAKHDVTHEDLEKRIRLLEYGYFISIGAIAIIQFLLKWFK